MFELTEADIFRLLDMFSTSDATFMQVRVGDVEVILSRNEQDGVRPEPSSPISAPVAAPQPAAAGGADDPRASVKAASSAPAPAASPTPTATSEDAGLVTVDASSVGTFYRAPRPDLPPYVEVGSTVEADTTVALIEAMKVFTGVTAGLQGTVVDVLVEDGQFVEYGQPLFGVRPTESGNAAGS